MLFITMNHHKHLFLQRPFPCEESELCSQDVIYPCPRHHVQGFFFFVFFKTFFDVDHF